jgi:SAM-dependent methyltransferase
LCHAALTGGVIQQDATARLRLSKVGYFLLHDSMTRVNFEFVRDVCYPALPALAQSVREGAPAGLAALGGRDTVYQTLLDLPAQARSSWFNFDHFYSDQAFSAALQFILEARPATLIDVGANTGRFAARCLAAAPRLTVTLVDHAPQLAVATRALLEQGHGQRVRAHALDLLTLGQEGVELPGPADVVWLSQLIDCLAPAAAVSVLSAARRALAPGGRVFVLEPCLDLQAHPAGTFCLAQTSLYFTCVANGTSRMYDSETLTGFLRDAGLEVCARHDHLGVGHSLFVARVAASTPR